MRKEVCKFTTTSTKNHILISLAAKWSPKSSPPTRGAKIGKKVTYENTSSGPDHSKEFSSMVLLSNKVIGAGKGKSKKNAEQMAAKEALLNAKK